MEPKQEDQNVIPMRAAVLPTCADLEGMLLEQMQATHQATMECFKLGMAQGGNHVQQRETFTRAAQLAGTFAVQLSALGSGIACSICNKGGEANGG